MSVLSILFSVMGWVQKNWKIVAIAAVIGLLTIQSMRLSHAKADLKTARLALVDDKTHETWQTEFKGCSDSLTAAIDATNTQNAAIASVQAESARKTALAVQALQEAAKSRAQASSSAQRLLSYRSTGKTACEALQGADAAVLKELNQ